MYLFFHVTYFQYTIECIYLQQIMNTSFIKLSTSEFPQPEEYPETERKENSYFFH